MDWAREARGARGPGPLGPGGRARAPPGPSPWPHNLGPLRGTKNQCFPVRKLYKKKIEKFLKFCSGEIGPSGNHAKMIFRWSGSKLSEVSKVFCLGEGNWPFRKACKNAFPMVRAKTKSQKFPKVFCWKLDPQEIMQTRFFRWSGQKQISEVF